MCYHCGAAHSCSRIADLVLKNILRFKVVPHSLSFVITIVKGYSIHCLFVLCNLYILNITRYRSQVIYRCTGFSETE